MKCIINALAFFISMTLFVSCNNPDQDLNILYVDIQNGSDNNSGRSKEEALQTITTAYSIIQPGDKLVILPGIYYERSILDELAATRDQPIHIVADIPGETVISGVWKETAEGKIIWKDEGNGIFSVEKSFPSLFAWTEDHHMLYRYMTLDHLMNEIVPSRDRYGLFKGPSTGFAYQDGKIYLKLPGDEDPNGKKIMFSLPSFGEEPTERLMIINSPYVILDGIRFQGTGTYGVTFTKPNCIIRNCIFEYCREGAAMYDNSLMEWCEYSYPGLYDLVEETKQINDGNIKIYPMAKDYHPRNWYEGSIAYPYLPDGTNSRSPRNFEIRQCFIHECFDGLLLGGFDDSEAHHNVFQNCYDNHVEIETWTEAGLSVNLHFHHNLLLSCPYGPISHQEPGKLKGPHFVYNNVVIGYDNHGWEPWTLIKSKCYGIGRGFYYYHNLFWVKSAIPYWNNEEWPQEWLKTFDFRNNIFVFSEEMRRPWGPEGSEYYFQSGGNLMVAENYDENVMRGFLRNGGIHLNTIEEVKFEDPSHLNFNLLPDSPAIDNGMEIE
ncbi:hypothetical protein ACFLU5_16480, partial [Bacteroidota bacterium]